MLSKNFTMRLAAAVCATLLAGRSVAQTRQFLEAPVVRGELRVQLDRTGKKLEWNSDRDGIFRGLEADKLFLTRESIRVGYSHFNPLRLGATSSVTAAPDPSKGVMVQLLEALASVGTAVVPGGQAAAGALENDLRARGRKAKDCLDPVKWLEENVLGKSHPELGNMVKGWTDTVDAGFNHGMSGPGAIQAAIKEIDGSINSLQSKTIDQAREKLKNLEGCASTWTDRAALYSFSHIVEQQLEKDTIFIAKAKELKKVLQDYTDRANWTGPNEVDYLVGDEVKPTMEEMRKVNIKVSKLVVSVDPVSGVLSTKSEDAASGNFSVRKFARFTPELGGGAVIGSVKQPKYGTGQNTAGQTIVAQAPSGSVSVNPVVMVNFVCRCETGWLTPMIQIGAAASKTTPAILTGLGIRLFGVGKGNVAVGGGAMYAWVKDLQKLKVGDVITGTKDIDADLGFRATPKIGAYMSIQYNF